MAKLGFYDIRTFECLTREIEVRKYDFYSIGNENVVSSLLPAEPAAKEGLENKRKKKQKEKDEKHIKSQLLATTPKTDIRGHTGYLTFAVKF